MATLLHWGVVNINRQNASELSLVDYLRLGLGAVRAQSLIDSMFVANIGHTTLIACVLIANAPQPILSILYFLFNSVFTSMLLAAEWADFAHERKPLRVSYPKPGQRSTYFLQLPYKYALPLMLLSGVLHWSVSQSLFLAQIRWFDYSGQPSEYTTFANISTCGYSVSGIILTIVMGSLLAIFALALGWRKFPQGMPLVRSSSAAIAEACHAQGVDTTVPLKWGITEKRREVEDSNSSNPQARFCGFSDLEISMPEEGKSYRGL